NKKDRLIPVIHPLMKCFEAEVLHLDDTCLKMLELVGEPAIEIYIKTTFRHWDLQEDTLQSIERFEKRGIPVSKLLLNALEDENEQVRERVVLLLKNNELKTFVKEAYSYFKNNIKSTERQIKEWAGEKKDKLITILRITQSLKRLNIENSEEIISYLLKTKNKTLIESICKNTDQILSGAVINRINTLSSPKDKVRALSLLDKTSLQIDAIKKSTEKGASKYFDELGGMPDKDSFVALKVINPTDENISFGVENWLNKERKASGITGESRKKASLFFRKHKDMPDGVLPQVLALIQRGVHEEEIHNRLRYVEEIKFLENHNITVSKNNISFLFRNKKYLTKLSEDKIVEMLEEKQEKYRKNTKENLQKLRRENIFDELNTGKKIFSEIFKDDRKFKLANGMFDDLDAVKTAAL
ncbi:MAG: hypothetical protein KAQ92_08020, partial [Candidatus Aenigmarchaeota archaeon]|nr:hypothetical protein [Candidatus Aenigmarchaeota archaeon]